MRMLTVSAFLLVVVASDTSQATSDFTRKARIDGALLQARSNADMPTDVDAELTRLRRNQAVLLAAINRLIGETAPISSAGPARAGFVTQGLIVDGDGNIVPGTVPAPDPVMTVRGVKPGDPLWREPLGSP